MGPTERGTVERLFYLTIFLKALLGVIQIISGGLIVILPIDATTGFIRALVQLELSEDPSDPLAGMILRGLSGITSEHGFYTIYLLLHGFLNAGVAAALALGRRWAYIASIAILVVFVGYQLWKYAQAPNALLLLLTGIDVLVIALSFLELRGMDARKDRIRT